MLGLHILGDRGLDEEDVHKAILTSGARTHVVLNNPGIAARAVLAGKRVLYRRWRNDHNNPGDNNAQDHYDPRDFVRRIHAEAPEGCYLVLGNEPWHQSEAQMRKLANWTMTALDECEKLGRKGAIFSLPTGNPPDTNVWEHAEVVLGRAKAGGHLLALHEYWGAGGETDPLGSRNHPWHIGRFTATALGRFLNVPEIVISELGYCHNMQPHTGWRNLISAQRYADYLTKIGAYYAGYGIDACIFAYGPTSGDFALFALDASIIEQIGIYNRNEHTIVHPPSNQTVWFLRPVDFPYVITSSFGPRENVEPKMHEGVDYAPKAGTPPPYKVLAARDGVVSKVGDNGTTGYGRFVRIDHIINGELWQTWYGHLERALVSEGQPVAAGQVIGHAGTTGNSSGIHLHWTIANDRYGLDGYPIRKAVDPTRPPVQVVAQVPGAPAPTPVPVPVLARLKAMRDELNAVIAELERS